MSDDSNSQTPEPDQTPEPAGQPLADNGEFAAGDPGELNPAVPDGPVLDGSEGALPGDDFDFEGVGSALREQAIEEFLRTGDQEALEQAAATLAMYGEVGTQLGPQDVDDVLGPQIDAAVRRIALTRGPRPPRRQKPLRGVGGKCFPTDANKQQLGAGLPDLRSRRRQR